MTSFERSVLNVIISAMLAIIMLALSLCIPKLKTAQPNGPTKVLVTITKGFTPWVTWGFTLLFTMVAVFHMVNAIFYYVQPVVPDNYCQFPSDIACTSFKLIENGTLNLAIGRISPNHIRVTGISCTQAQTPPEWVAKDVRINVAEHSPLGAITCTKADGTPATGTVGEAARMKIFINYTEIGTDVNHTLEGDMRATYEPA